MPHLSILPLASCAGSVERLNQSTGDTGIPVCERQQVQAFWVAGDADLGDRRIWHRRQERRVRAREKFGEVLELSFARGAQGTKIRGFETKRIKNLSNKLKNI